MGTYNIIHSEISESYTPVHPSVFPLLILPLGMMGGYVTVALDWLYAKEGFQ